MRYICIVYELINMLDSDWCIVGSMMAVMTLDVKLEWNSISNLLDSTHQEILLCQVILDMVFVLMVNSDYE